MNILLTVKAGLVCLILSSAIAPRPEENGRVYVSQDHGLNWRRADNGLPENDGIKVLIVHNKRVVAGTGRHGIWAMDNNGWYSQSTGLPEGSRVISLLSYNQLLYAGLYQRGLYYSADDGSTWHPAGNRQLKNIRALTGYRGAVYAGTDEGIYQVDVRDGNWRQLLGGVQINSFACNERYVYAATHRGVVRSDNGLAWESVYEGGAINKMALNKREILLMNYAGDVYRSEQERPLFIRDDLFLPRHYFKLTPASAKILGNEWSDLSSVNSGARRGMPETTPVSILVQTPYGVMAVSFPGGDGC